MSSTSVETSVTPPHPRVLGWFGTSALAMGGSNQMIFLITALFVGQGEILGQGSAAVPLLIFGVLLGWAAAPAWTELVLMWPNRVGGISAACAEAFRPYNPVLSALTGTCYWWGWVPTCGEPAGRRLVLVVIVGDRSGQLQVQAVESMIRRSSDVLLLQIGLVAGDLRHGCRRLNFLAEFIRWRPLDLLIAGHLVDFISCAAEGRCRRLSREPRQGRDCADGQRWALGRGIGRRAGRNRGGGRLRRILRRDAPAHGLAGRILRLGRRRCGKEQACAPAALILWRRGKDAYPRSKPGAGG